jgi:hypothetical protein
MFELALATVLSTPVYHKMNNDERVNRYCAYLVGIPYASDNFTQKEYERFLSCVYMFGKDEN